MFRRFLTILVTLAIAHAAHGLSIVNYNSAQFDRFSSGFSSSPVPNTSSSFIGAGYDFSGVGWRTSQPLASVTMINDRYFIGANHIMPSAGDTINFYSPTLGAVVTYTVDNYNWRAGAVSTITGEPGDLSIGRLTASISPAAHIASYPILNLKSFSPYVGLPLLVYGHGNGVATNSPRIGTNTLDGFLPVDFYANNIADSVDYAFSMSAGPTGEASLQSFDSGSPTFASWFGQLAIVGTHSGTGTISGTNYAFDNFAAIYLNQIMAAGIEISEVPEPSKASLLGLSLMAVALRRRRA
jgi:hypothetical protein